MFALPPGTALRYERPHRDLSRYITSYAVLDSEADTHRSAQSWMLPSWAQIWIIITDQPIVVTIGNRRYDPMPPAALYGVTSRAMPVTSNGGVSVVIDISPLGWARLFNQPAEDLRDRVTPLQNVMSPILVDELVTRLCSCDLGPQVKGVLDEFFRTHMTMPHPAEDDIAELMRIMVDPDLSDAGSVAERMEMSPAAIRRLSKRFFGFPIKTLMMRGRFVRQLIEMMERNDGRSHPPGALETGYHDASHFIRDGKRFLGMTPRQFASLEAPYLAAVLRARRLVLGSPTPSVDNVPAPTAGDAVEPQHEQAL